MKIQVLGTGCAKCRQLTENVKLAVTETGVEAVIEKVESLEQIMGFGVMATPALVIDGVVKASGKVSSVEEIKELVQK